MRITRITLQAKVKDRYSVFVDGVYAFSLSEQALLESGLAPKQELTEAAVTAWKSRSADDKLWQRTLRYVAMRQRSRWEVKTYLERKGASPALIEQILNKLSINHFIDDMVFAHSMVADQQLLRPASKRKLQHKLRAKHVPEEAIRQVFADEPADDRAALASIIAKKRRLLRFQHDTQKLIAYLARQGFQYDDIRAAFDGASEASSDAYLGD